MKKIFQTLFIFLTIGLSLTSCHDYKESYSTIPELYAPTLRSVTVSSAVFSEYSHYDYYSHAYYFLYVSPNSDMSDAVECENVRNQGVAYGLKANTTYYAQYTATQYCEEGEATIKSPITEFKTPAYEPTNYTISLSQVPAEGNYGVFTVDANGITSYESVKYGSTLKPSTRIADNSTVYLTYPYISGSSDPKSVSIYGGTDFYYTSGTVSPASPSLKLTPKRYTANVDVNVTFKAAKEDADNVKLTGVTIANVDGNTPICSDGHLNLATGEFTPSESAGRYTNSTSTSVSSGKSVSRKFYGVLPIKFGEKAVKVVLNLSGDINEKEVSVILPAANWAPGSDVKVNLNAEYTATGVELYVGSVNVTPWATGSTGNIDITK